MGKKQAELLKELPIVIGICQKRIQEILETERKFGQNETTQQMLNEERTLLGIFEKALHELQK